MRKTAPKPTVNTPLFLAGDFLADIDGYLYEPTGQAAIIDGEHATIASTNAEADRWAKHEW
jgi:hypothetical protein